MDEIKAVKVEIPCRVMIQTESKETHITVFARGPKDAIDKAVKIFKEGQEKKSKKTVTQKDKKESETKTKG